MFLKKHFFVRPLLPFWRSVDRLNVDSNIGGSTLNQIVTIPKDILNRLQKLAVDVETNERRYAKAQQVYHAATAEAAGSSVEFANELYDFVLKYQPLPDLIDQRLEELNLKTKASTSIYHRIARLAFAGVDKGAEARSQISKYGSLMQEAHAKGMTLARFKDLTSVSLARLISELDIHLSPDAKAKVKTGRELASQLLGEEELSFESKALTETVPEGGDVQLLARHENGRLVVYGAMPTERTEVNALLQRIGAKHIASQRKNFDAFSDIARLLRLSGQATDETVTGTLQEHGGNWTFILASKISASSITVPAPSASILNGSVVSLPATKWDRLCASIGALKGEPLRIVPRSVV